MELEPIAARFSNADQIDFLLAGVGPVESAMNLTEHLTRLKPGLISGVINIGLAGAYPQSGPDLHDICLAEKEVFGDIGISLAESIAPLDSSFAPPGEFILDSDLFSGAANLLTGAGLKFHRGTFVTVAAASGLLSRGNYLRAKFGAICENMEGAAVARVCQKFALPCLELRCISNMVVDRQEQHWSVKEAVAICAQAAHVVIEGLQVG